MRHIFDPTNGRLPNRTSKIVTGGTEAQDPVKALENLNGIDIDLVGQPDGILGLDDTGGLYFENANLNTLFPAPQVKGPGSVYVNHKAYYLITNYDYNKAYTLTPIGNGQATLSKNTVTYTAPSEPTVEGDGFTVNGVDFPITVMEITIINQVLEPSIIVPNTPTIEYSALKYRFESTEFRYTGVTQHHVSSSWEIATDVNFTNIVTSVTDSTNFKTAWELLDTETNVLLKNIDYYIRIKHTGDVTGGSTWSSFIKFQIKEEFQTELPYVKKPSVISYLPSSTSIVHPPFILYGGDGQDPNSMSTNRSLQLITDGYASACSLNNSAIVNTVQHRKNPYANYPSVGRFYDVGITVNSMDAIGNELWLIGDGIAKYNPLTDTVSELSLGEIAISSVYGLTNVCQHGENLYAIGKDLDYILQYYDGPIPEFRPMARHGLPIQQYSGVTVSNNVAYAVSRTVGLYKKPNGSNDFQLVVSNNSDWSSVTIVDGTVYATVLGGDIYKYNDTNQTLEALNQGNRYWTGIAAKGTDVYACVRNGYIYKQTNGTGNFVAITSDSQYWRSIYSDGIDVYATTDYNSDVYIQRNGIGPFFSLTQIQYAWTDSITLSNGDMYGCLNNGDIYVRKSGELYFAPLNQTARTWDSLTALGSDIYACVYGGDIYKQTNGTGDFVALNQTARNWSGLATVGATIYATVDNGDIYTLNTVSGVFEPLSQTQRQWQGVAYHGADVYAIDYVTGIYKQTNATGNFVLLTAGSNFKDIVTVGASVYVSVHMGGIYKKTGSGDFLSLSQTARQWDAVFSDGNDVYATAWQNVSGTFKYVLYKQTNGTGDFVVVATSNNISFTSVSKLGDDIYATSGYAVYKKLPNEITFNEVAAVNEGGIDTNTSINHLYMDGSTVYVATATTLHSSSTGLANLALVGQTRAWWADICSSNGNLYAAEASLGVYLVNTTDGTLINLHDSSPIAGSYSSLESLNNKLYFTAGHIYAETATPNVFDVVDNTQSSFIELAASDDHMFVRTSDCFIYKQANGTGTFDLVVSDLSEITSMAVLNNVLYTHVNSVNNYIPVQNGLGRYDMNGAPIYDSKTSLAPIFYTHSLISSSFESVGGSQDHVSSSWQIALDAGFHNVVYEADKDTVYKTNINFSGLIPNTNYYARIKHTGSIWGDSTWSDAYPFSFTDFNIPNDDFYDQILSNRLINLLGVVKHSTAINTSGTVVAIGMTEIQYDGFVDSDAIVVIYRKDSNTWVRDGEFVITGKHQFGLSMAMNSAGNKLFVGAPFYGNSGAVFLYERDEIEWTESNMFQDPIIGGGDEGGGSECFGASVTCDALGNRVAIGRTAVNDAYYAGISSNGSVHVYDRQLDGFWSEPTNLVANDPQPDSGFGASLSMSNDGYMLIIGAPNHNVGIGKVYILYYEDSSWAIVQTLTPHDTNLDVAFGHSVSLAGDGSVFYVGAPYYDDERNQNNVLTQSGSVYAYKKDTLRQTWYLHHQWIHYVSEEYFGKSVSTNTNGSMLAIATDYKTFVYQEANDQYILNVVEPTRDIDPTTFGRIYTKTSSISGSGTCLVQSLKYTDAFYNNYIHIKTLGVFTPQNHIGTDWQIASDREFTNILVNVTNDTQQKEVYESPAIFPMRTSYFVRARYNSENLGYTQWSLPMAVSTMDMGEE